MAPPSTLVAHSARFSVRLWLYMTGLHHQAQLIRNLILDWKYRASTEHGMVVLAQNLLNLLWRSVRLLLIPDVFFRFFAAVVSLQALFEFGAVARRMGLKLLLQCSAKGRKRLQLRTAMERATNLDKRRALGQELDVLEGHDKWRQDPSSGLFLYERVQNKIAMYRRLQSERDIMGIMFALRAGLLRKHWGLGNPRLYGVSHVGTKHVVDEYMDAVLTSMDMVLQARRNPSPHRSMQHPQVDDDALSIENKLAFFSETRHAFGRSALMLSGGGGLGLYHTGIVKTLVEQGLLPNVISGSSAGSIVAGCVGVRTDEELNEVFQDGHLDLYFFDANVSPRELEHYTPSWLSAMQGLVPCYDSLQHAYVVAARFLDKGYMLDITRLKQNLRNNMGDYTFREAYDRTGRIINITVTPSQSTDYPQLLNYLTAPNVLVWSASLASCAIPMVFSPVELYGKDQHGNVVPVYREGLKWSDGSVECDLPMERLSELFNVNHFIVSQVNIHYKFISGYESHGGGDILGFLKKQMKAYIKNIAEFGLNTSVLKLFGVGLVPLLTQTYEGDITISIASQVSFLQLAAQVLTNPSPSSFQDLVLAGERSTWPHLSRIQAMCRIEFALERAVRFLRGEQALEEEKRTGISSLGRVPSFYTSASSMNLSSMTQPSPLASKKSFPSSSKKPLGPSSSTIEGTLTADDSIQESTSPIRRNKSINVAGAVMNMESVLGGFGARHGASFE
ncbi:hypothetical protein H310_08560 [Aphanomyces invadans]|uniref:PNPLA domain-containing protein n=1 Tax=Aphanomyces invadans TaxID=157072 RepID=A0A024U0L1_9STRA|nr:hypothetical protein H310_08560 [Aphanomyces invadans]ETV99157.1 hypothetical protein H310_08560 [Aphanomyces invadans]|eukprot:XP_008872585.1 hypothetical protein H310_08560 [Aphanomyces invadans]